MIVEYFEDILVVEFKNRGMIDVTLEHGFPAARHQSPAEGIAIVTTSTITICFFLL